LEKKNKKSNEKSTVMEKEIIDLKEQVKLDNLVKNER
jgi:hypothetical protein